jgi:IclR family acetate operon transcriptional repressor
MSHSQKPATDRRYSSEEVADIIRLSLQDDSRRNSDALIDHDELMAIAKDVGVSSDQIDRAVLMLEEEQQTRDKERGLWFVGVGAFTVGAAFLKVRDVVAIARPAMRRLMERAGESVNLAVRDADQAVYLSQVECRQMMRALAAPGGRAPLHASGVGKALLMALPEAELGAVLARLSLDALTARTLTDPGALIQDLAGARSRGYAVDDEEHAVGLRCVAAPIRNEYGETVAAISLSGPQARIGDSRLLELGTLIAATAAEVSGEYGG